MKQSLTLCIAAILFSTTSVNAGTWATLDPSGENVSQIHLTGVSGNNIVGIYLDDSWVMHRFFYNGAAWGIIEKPEASETVLEAIDETNIVGHYEDTSGSHGFLYNGTLWTTLDPPGENVSHIHLTGISGNNIVGIYSDDSGMHSFLYNGAAWDIIEKPEASETVLEAIDETNIVGHYEDTSGSHGFLYNGANWTTLDPPGENVFQIHLTGISGNNIVGIYSDDSGMHSFLYNGETWSTHNKPGASETVLEAIDENHIVGHYWDASGPHGFLYTFSDGDINKDGEVNMIDFAILAGQWKGLPGIFSADIAPAGGDGMIDFKDLSVMITDWLDSI